MAKVRAKLNFVGTTAEGFNKIGQEWEVSDLRAKELLERDLVEVVDREKKEGVEIKEKAEVEPFKKNKRVK